MESLYQDERTGRVLDCTQQDICQLRADRVVLMMQALCSWRVLEARAEFLCGLSDLFPSLDPMGVL